MAKKPSQLPSGIWLKKIIYPAKTSFQVWSQTPSSNQSIEYHRKCYYNKTNLKRTNFSVYHFRKLKNIVFREYLLLQMSNFESINFNPFSVTKIIQFYTKIYEMWPTQVQYIFTNFSTSLLSMFNTELHMSVTLYDEGYHLEL